VAGPRGICTRFPVRLDITRFIIVQKPNEYALHLEYMKFSIDKLYFIPIASIFL
jgi:hypothetical protein